MPKGKDAVDLARAGFRQAGETSNWSGPVSLSNILQLTRPCVLPRADYFNHMGMLCSRYPAVHHMDMLSFPFL